MQAGRKAEEKSGPHIKTDNNGRSPPDLVSTPRSSPEDSALDAFHSLQPIPVVKARRAAMPRPRTRSPPPTRSLSADSPDNDLYAPDSDAEHAAWVATEYPALKGQ